MEAKQESPGSPGCRDFWDKLEEPTMENWGWDKCRQEELWAHGPWSRRKLGMHEVQREGQWGSCTVRWGCYLRGEVREVSRSQIRLNIRVMEGFWILSMMRSRGVGCGGRGLNSRTRQFDLHFKKEWLSKVFRCGLSRRKQPPVLPLLLSTWAGRQCNWTQYCTAVTSCDLSQMCSGGRKGEEDAVCMPTSNWAATQAPGFPVKCINYLCYF